MPPETSEPVKGTVVLVVEDNDLILMSAVDLVESAGYEALAAANADEAIAILEGRTDVKLVFTDIEMPGTLDGVKLAHYIRDRWPPIQLIVASGRTIKEEFQLPTGSSFFSKPYDHNSIVDEMARMLALIETASGGQKI